MRQRLRQFTLRHAILSYPALFGSLRQTMRAQSRQRLIVLCLLFVPLLAACQQRPPVILTDTPLAVVLTWDKTPGTVIFRLDQIILDDPPYRAANRLPLCTLYGDGLLVWVNSGPKTGSEVLEAYIDDTAFRSFLEFIIRDQRFYQVPDFAAEVLPPSQNAVEQSITLKLNNEVRTVRNYTNWPQNVYNELLKRCTSLTNTPTRFVPDGAWLTVYSVKQPPQAPQIQWPPTAPFKMSDLAAAKNAIWANGPALHELWNAQRQNNDYLLWLENGKVYQVAIQVPGISRDAPPSPQLTPTPVRTQPPTLASPSEH